MGEFKVNKTYAEINEKIRSGKAVVVTAEEIIGIVKENGPVEAAAQVDVVTTGTFAPMCSSGAFLNIGQSTPSVRTTKTWFNDVPAYSGVAAVDCFLGATEVSIDDPLNKIHPGEFNYGGGHVLQDLVAGKKIEVRAESYGTDCYPNRKIEKFMTLADMPQAIMCNPRNGYQNYNCAINRTDKTKYTYMGTLKPGMANANYCSAGQLSPLFNDPYFKNYWYWYADFSWGGTRVCILERHPAINQMYSGDLTARPLTPAGYPFLSWQISKRCLRSGWWDRASGDMGFLFPWALAFPSPF